MTGKACGGHKRHVLPPARPAPRRAASAAVLYAPHTPYPLRPEYPCVAPVLPQCSVQPGRAQRAAAPRRPPQSAAHCDTTGIERRWRRRLARAGGHAAGRPCCGTDMLHAEQHSTLRTCDHTRWALDWQRRARRRRAAPTAWPPARRLLAPRGPAAWPCCSVGDAEGAGALGLSGRRGAGRQRRQTRLELKCSIRAGAFSEWHCDRGGSVGGSAGVRAAPHFGRCGGPKRPIVCSQHSGDRIVQRQARVPSIAAQSAHALGPD